MSPRRRVLVIALATLVAVWASAVGGYVWLQRSRMTAAKIREFAQSINLEKLAAVERGKVLREWAERINALSPEERRQWRKDPEWKQWFAEMSEDEKQQFIETTMPTGFKQVMNSFEQLPEAQRKRTIDDAMKHLRDTHELRNNREPGRETDDMYGADGPPPLSPELEAKVNTIGLRTFYRESTAETKAELAPLLEELQRQMSGGRVPR